MATIAFFNLTATAAITMESLDLYSGAGDSATPVPTMSAYGLALTVPGLLVVARRRLRASSKRK